MTAHPPPAVCTLCVGSGFDDHAGRCRRCRGTGNEPTDDPRMRAAETGPVELWEPDFDLWEIEPTVRPERSR